MKKWFRKLIGLCLVLALAAFWVPAPVQAEGVETFTVGEFKEDVEIPSDKSGVTYRFVPDETRTYAFAGKAYSDAFLELCVLEDGEEIACVSNDETESSSAVCFFEAEVGKEYLLNVVTMHWLYDTCITDLWLEIPCAPEAMYFSDDYLTGSAGDEFDLQLQFEPLWAIPEDCVWETTDPSVASVDQNGHVVLLSNGYAEIYATTESGMTAYCMVEVVSLEAVQFDYPFKTGYVGKTEILQYSFEPYGTSDTVTITSSDPSVAEVRYDEDWDNWEVAYKALGSATLTITTAGGLSGTCQVTVKEMETISLGDIITVTVQPGDQLSYIFTPEESAEYAFCSEERVGLFNIGGGVYSDECRTAVLEANESYILSVLNDYVAEMTCTLRLEKSVPVETVEIIGKTKYYVGDDWGRLQAITYPVWAQDEEWTWSTDAANIVDVSGCGWYGDLTLGSVGTAMITVTMDSGATASVPVAVREPEVIRCGFSETLTLGYHDDAKYSFTPEKSGTYAFYMEEGESVVKDQGEDWTSEYITRFTLVIDCDGESVASSELGADVYGYVVASCEMEAGKTYELRAGHSWGEEVEITGTVYFDRVEPPEEFEIVCNKELILDRSGFVLYCQPKTGVPFILGDITWSVSDETVVGLDLVWGQGDNWVNCSTESVGTAVVTATLPNGVSTSYEVTVVEKTQYEISEGNGAIVSVNSTEPLVLKINAKLEKFNNRVSEGLDDLTPQHYSVSECEDGMLIILKPEYLSILSPGWHTITVNFADGVAYPYFQIVDPSLTVITGTITSYGNATDIVSILMYPEGSVVPQYGTSVLGNSGSYSIPNVSDGTYVLLVTKDNHVARKYTIVVDGEDVIQDVVICHPGDTNADGKLNVGDVARIYGHIRGTSSLQDDYVLLCADVSGDTKLNVGDVARVYSHVRGTNALW